MPELAELADPMHEHLAALARAAAGAETVAPGAQRSVFDSWAARSGLPAEPSDGSGSAATSRVAALSAATVDAVEALTATIASRHRRHAACVLLTDRRRHPYLGKVPFERPFDRCGHTGRGNLMIPFPAGSAQA